MTDDELLAARAEAFGSLFVLMQHLSRRADRELADLGLTSRQWLLLAILGTTARGTSLSLSEAAERYGSSRQNVKQVALGLQTQGFVHLVPDLLDRRTTRIELTERIHEFDTPAMVAASRGMLDDVFTGLTRDETHDLLALLRRWLAALTTPDLGEDHPA
jgi:DNA-binding MarR family transcriptional regulator